MGIKQMENKSTCDFCKITDSIGVYSTDYGPFSLAYCEECLKHKNIRTIFNGLSIWARFGDEAFEEYKIRECGEYEPNVFFNGNYITLRELVKIITVNDVEKYFKHRNTIMELIITKLNERNTKQKIIKNECRQKRKNKRIIII